MEDNYLKNGQIVIYKKIRAGENAKTTFASVYPPWEDFSVRNLEEEMENEISYDQEGWTVAKLCIDNIHYTTVIRKDNC